MLCFGGAIVLSIECFFFAGWGDKSKMHATIVTCQKGNPKQGKMQISVIIFDGKKLLIDLF